MEFGKERQKDVVVVDYGVGNHLSILNALQFLGYTYLVSAKKEDLRSARCFILPGVGAFGEAMDNLHRLGIIPTLHEEIVQKKKLLLGICLGMQILAEDSQENGFHQGLGWIPGHVTKISGGQGVRVPHVGWNQIQAAPSCALFSRTGEKPHVYFDHSYHLSCQPSLIAATVQYGKTLVAAIRQENIFGVQFHPEKSQNNGLRMYRGFFDYVQRWEDTRQSWLEAGEKNHA